MSRYQLAQVNIARMRAPLDSPLLASFVARLDEINALADSAPGFIWRLQSDTGDATSIRAYADDLILVNLSVWESPEHLSRFVYKSMHTEVMKQRRTWFEKMESLYYALWWVPAGHKPDPAEARQKLEKLNKHGSNADVFLFGHVFPPPGH